MSTWNTLIGRVIVKLKAISIVGGYTYDQDSDYVLDWDQMDILEDDFSDTALIVADPSGDADDTEGYSENVDRVEVHILNGGQTNIAKQRNQIGDVKKAMFALLSDTASLAAGLDDVSYQGKETAFDREKRLIGETTVFFDLTYKTDRDKA